MSYSISWELHAVNITYLDHVTFDQFMEAILTIHASQNYAGIRYVIHDMLSATDVDFSGVDMTKIVAHELGARFTNTRVRPAVVSTNPTMGEMIQVFSQMTNLEVGLFTNVTEAVAWGNAYGC
jgi:DNA-binding MurR/RpiR family transcriptional regulator